MNQLTISNKKDFGINEFLTNLTSEHSRRAYKNDLDNFFQFLNSLGFVPQSPKEVELKHFLAYREALTTRGMAPTSINRKFASIRSLWSWFRINKHVDENILASLKLPKAAVTNPTKAFSDDEVTTIIASELPGSYRRLILMFLFYTGMRRSELVNLNCKHICKHGSNLIVNIKGKGGKTRQLPLNDKLVIELNLYLSLNSRTEDEPLIQAMPGKRLDPTTVYKLIKKYARDKSPHSCRATAITKALEAGAVITDVADMAGHATINTTQIYWKRRRGFEESPVHKLDY